MDVRDELPDVRPLIGVRIAIRVRRVSRKPTQASPSEKCLRQSRCTFNTAHARRLRSLLFLHFQFYRGPPPLARAAVRDHKRPVDEEVCAGLGRPTTKRCRGPHQPSGGRTTQNITPLFGPTCLGAQTCAPPSGATTLLILSLGTGVHSPSTLTS